MKQILLFFISVLVLGCSDDDTSTTSLEDQVSLEYVRKDCAQGNCFLKFKLSSEFDGWLGLNVKYNFNRLDSHIGSNHVIRGEAATEAGESFTQIQIDPDTEFVSLEILEIVPIN